jgi:hypothetical protein
VTGKAAALQGGLAALGLITAHLTWQREPERAPGDVTLLDAGKNDLGRIHYEDDLNVVDLERRKDAGDNGIWLHLTEKAKPTHPQDPKAPPQPTAAVDPPRDLNGSDVAAKLLEQFAPLRSPRAFGVLDAAKLKELGLEGSKRKLTVGVKGDTREFTVGSPPGPGSGESFLRDTRDGRVYLMPHGIAGDLQSTTRLVDRKLHGFEAVDFDRMVLTVGGKSREFIQTHRENQVNAQLSSPKTPDKPDQMAKNFHELLWRSFPMEILGKGEVPKDGQPVPMARLEYFDGKKSLGYLDIARTAPDSVQQTDQAGNRTTMYARTERTAGWVKIHTNGQLQSDAEKLVAGGP